MNAAIPKPPPPVQVTLTVDGQRLNAIDGQSVGAALLTHDIRVLRRAPGGGAPRGLFCAMGVCLECLVTIDGRPARRACREAVRDGMVIETGGP